jgi:hypothetical protein
LMVACGGTASVEGSGAGGSSSNSTSRSSARSTGTTTAAGGFDGMPECTSSEQCALCNDCCTCAGTPADVSCPTCDIQTCEQAHCSAIGYPSPIPMCSAGRCVAGFICDQLMAFCNVPPPTCPVGQAASVLDGCWGPCVPATECLSVTRCGQCDPATQVCVLEQAFDETRHCVDLPAACQGRPLCECMGSSVCVSPFDLCAETPSGEISCGCPTC